MEPLEISLFAQIKRQLDVLRLFSEETFDVYGITKYEAEGEPAGKGGFLNGTERVIYVLLTPEEADVWNMRDYGDFSILDLYINKYMEKSRYKLYRTTTRFIRSLTKKEIGVDWDGVEYSTGIVSTWNRVRTYDDDTYLAAVAGFVFQRK